MKVDTSSWRLPTRLLPYLEPGAAVRALSSRLPEMDVRGFTADRIDPGSVDVTLQGRMRVADAGRECVRLVSVRVNGAGTETVRVSPDDPALPSPRQVLEHPYVERMLRAAPDGVDRDPAVRVLAHRPGKRACFRVELPSTSFLVRVYARRGDESLVTTLRALACHWERVPAAVPRVAFHDRDRRLVALTWLPGTPLHAILGAAPSSIAASAGRTVRAYQTVPTADLPFYGSRDELGTISKLARRAGRLRPDLGRELETTAETVAVAAEHLADDPVVFAHRDLHDKQWIVADGGLGIIDWDCATASPAGLDPGNFLAHLILRLRQGRIDDDRARGLRTAFLTAYLGSAAETRRRLGTWETLALLRLAAVYALRPAWPGLAESLLALVRKRQR